MLSWDDWKSYTILNCWICPEHVAMEITKNYIGPHNEKGSNYFSEILGSEEKDRWWSDAFEGEEYYVKRLKLSI